LTSDKEDGQENYRALVAAPHNFDHVLRTSNHVLVHETVRGRRRKRPETKPLHGDNQQDGE
jgi:hypothetical protein